MTLLDLSMLKSAQNALLRNWAATKNNPDATEEQVERAYQAFARMNTDYLIAYFAFHSDR